MTSRIIERVTNPFDLGRLLRGLAPAEPEEERVCPCGVPTTCSSSSWRYGICGWRRTRRLASYAKRRTRRRP
jgi:hypothetical protein